ncbi:hypothetical protein AB0K18_18660 [Nonomuraea sp. NPDC049421]|uniref:hypothetical protein n=1 Tax=Nonomuraea sp. NPDC049421 TaxID=3155275 RepID=UPI0034159257
MAPDDRPEPSPYLDWEPERLPAETPAWRRAPVLVGVMAALLVLALTGWLVVARTDAGGAAGGSGGPAGTNQADVAPPVWESTPADDTDPALATGDAAADAGAQTDDETDEQAEDPGEEQAEEQAEDPGDDQAEEQAGAGSGKEAGRQAQELDKLLSSSNSSRSDLTEAIDEAVLCERAGPDSIKDITNARRRQLTAARRLTVSALPDGAQLRDALVTALDASYQADLAFLSWARKLAADGCPGVGRDHPDYRRGLDWSKAAHEAKTRFVRTWRPVAEKYGLTVWKARQI